MEDFRFLGMSFWDWASLVTRWVHLYAAILWVGQTHLFGWLERVYHGQYPGLTIEKEDGRRTVWTVHGGGFFVMEKITKPDRLREHLHWFRFEALLTWVTGILLLSMLYYRGGLAIDESVMPLSEWQAAGVGLGSFAVAWLFYDGVMRTPMGDKGLVTAAFFMPFVAAAAYGYTHVFGGRGAFYHMAGMFGTMMVANVWLNITPAHRKMVAALERGEEPDMTVGEKAAHRSVHNSYLVVPVLMLMLSNKFFQLYGHEQNWLILVGIVVVGWCGAAFVKKVA